MIEKSGNTSSDISARFRDTEAVTAALKKAARRAISEHARDGQQIVVWRDGQVVWVDAKEHASDSADHD